MNGRGRRDRSAKREDASDAPAAPAAHRNAGHAGRTEASGRGCSVLSLLGGINAPSRRRPRVLATEQATQGEAGTERSVEALRDEHWPRHALGHESAALAMSLGRPLGVRRGSREQRNEAA